MKRIKDALFWFDWAQTVGFKIGHLFFEKMNFSQIATLAQKAAINEGTMNWLAKENREELEFVLNLTNEISKPFFITSEKAKMQIVKALQTEIEYRKAQIEELLEEEETPAIR